jgi:hypothetical protein
MRFVSFIGLFATVFVVATPAAHAEKVKYNARISAKYPAVAASETVAVVNFNGRDGVAFGGVLASVLQSAELDGDIIATTGRNTGEVNRSEVVRLAIEKLATCNGDKTPASPDEASL